MVSRSTRSSAKPSVDVGGLGGQRVDLLLCRRTGAGRGTTGLAVGDRAFGLTDRHRDGAAAELVAVEARDLAVLPAGIDHVAGAALPMAADCLPEPGNFYSCQ